MLSAALLVSVALAALPSSVSSLHESRELQRRGEFVNSFWSIDGPDPIDGTPAIRFESRENGTEGWEGILYNGGGYLWTPDIYAGTFGLRLVDDDDSAVIYYYSSDNIMATATHTTYPVNGTEDVGTPSLTGLLGALLTTFSNVTSVPSNTSIWNPEKTVGDAPLIPSKTVIVDAVDCDYDLTFTVTTVDANGETLEFTGLNRLGAPVPLALPATVTVSSTNSSGGIIFHYNGVEPWSVTYGSTHLAQVDFTQEAYVYYCET